MDNIIQILASELGRKPEQIEAVVTLLDEGNTIPFIARYRKELHGSMDDTALRTLETRLQYLRNLQERRETVLAAIEAQEQLTPELRRAIENAATLAELEDLYRPYKPKRRTRATAAREQGLAPLAALLFAQAADCPEPEEAAKDYVNPEKGVETVEAALAGASDIIAEEISDSAELRKALKRLIAREGQLRSTDASEEDSVYSLYYEFARPVSKLQGHQVLAINRGEKEIVRIRPDSGGLTAENRHILLGKESVVEIDLRHNEPPRRNENDLTAYLNAEATVRHQGETAFTQTLRAETFPDVYAALNLLFGTCYQLDKKALELPGRRRVRFTNCTGLAGLFLLTFSHESMAGLVSRAVRIEEILKFIQTGEGRTGCIGFGG